MGQEWVSQVSMKQPIFGCAIDHRGDNIKLALQQWPKAQ